MFIFHKDIDQYFYHYTKSNTAIEFILNTGTLKFSSYKKTNDPKEVKNWLFSAGTNERKDLTGYTSETLNFMNYYLKDRTNVLCFSRDQALTGDHIIDMPKRGFCKPRMWAQYADNHAGICLIFNTKLISDLIFSNLKNYLILANNVHYADRLFPHDEQAFIVNVDYLEKVGEEKYAFSHGRTHAEQLYFEKALDWVNETEYRWVVFDTEGELKFEYKKSLSGIVFGESCSPEDVQEIVELTSHLHLEYQQLRWKNSTPMFDYNWSY